MVFHLSQVIFTETALSNYNYLKEEIMAQTDAAILFVISLNDINHYYCKSLFIPKNSPNVDTSIVM